MNLVLGGLINLSVLFLPTLSNLVKHGGSLILLILTICGIIAWASKRNPIRLTTSEKWVMWSFVAYFVVILLFFLGHGLFNDAIPFDWEHDNDSRMTAFVPILIGFLIFRPRAGCVWYGLSAGAILACLYSIFYTDAFHSAQRATGAYHAIAFGDLSLLCGFMSMAGISYFRNNHPLLISIPILAMLGGIVAAILSSTRGAIIAIPALIIVLMFQISAHPRAWFFRILIIVGLAAGGGAFFLLGSTLDNRIRDSIKQASLFLTGQNNEVEDARLKMWTEAIDIIKHNFWVGVGHGGYRPIISEKAKTHPELKSIVRFHTPHNNFLANMVDYGILGLIITIALFFSPLLVFLPNARSNCRNRDFAFAGLILVVSYAIFGLTETLFFRYVFIPPFLILNAVLIAFCHPDNEFDLIDNMSNSKQIGSPGFLNPRIKNQQ